MRILFLNSARNWGGNEKWVAMSAQVLADRHDVRIAYRCPVVGKRMARIPEVQTVRWAFLASFDVATLARLIGYVRQERIDVLIPTKRKDYVLAGLAAQITGVCNILRLGIVRRLHPWTLQRWVYGKWADGIIVNAPSIRDAVNDSGLIESGRIAVIPNGVDQAVVMAAINKRAAPPFPFSVVTLGKLTERKDVETIIRGLAELNSEIPEAGLVIIGDGPMRKQLEGLANELGVIDRVVFRGYKINPYPDLAAAHVFVSTSKNEGFPNTVIEALYLGVPVIATAAGGTWDWLTPDKDGLQIPFADPLALAKALKTLHDDNERRHRLTAHGQQTAYERFDLQRMGDHLDEFLDIIRG